MDCASFEDILFHPDSTHHHTPGQGYLSAAKPDALAFVASDGDIRGAYFEQALVVLRSGGNMTHASDAQIAEAVAALR
jgi:uncharacterized protein (TIGR02448 family)